MANERGRPKKEINQKEFERLCFIQATLKEIAGWFDCSKDTIKRYCESTYGKTFEEVFEEKRAGGLISLRRSQFRMSEKNVAMAIWLGKQYLGQKDTVLFGPNNTVEDDPLTKSIKDAFNEPTVSDNNADGI